MKSASRFSIILLAAGGTLVGTFFLGQHYGGERFVEQKADGSAQFLAGQALERGRRAWINAANLHSYLAFFDSDRLDELTDRIEGNLWYSIPDLYQLTINSDASDQERDGAKMVLKRVVLYFYKHPREHVQPQGVNLSEAVEKNPLSSDPDSTEQKVFSELAEGPVRALRGFDEAIEQVLVKASEMDLEIQRILDQQIARREFPGREKSWGGMTIHLPSLPGPSGGGSNDQSFRQRGEDFDLVVTRDRITFNGNDYGELSSISTIDFRVPNKVFVDGKQRMPSTEEAQQAGTGQPATSPESDSEGGEKPQPEAEEHSR